MFDSLIDRFDYHVSSQPKKEALTFVNEKLDVIKSYTYDELNAQSDRLAVYLCNELGLVKGDRALLVFPPCLEFIVTFLGCLKVFCHFPNVNINLMYCIGWCNCSPCVSS